MYYKTLLIACLLTCGLLSAKPLDVDVLGQSVILINGETGQVLFEKNANAIQFPASTTKVATALYALNQVGHRLDEMVTAEQDAIASITTASLKRQEEGKIPPYWLLVGGTHIGIKRDETMPLRALFYGMMLASGNDAANVIAQHVGGTITDFMKGMNVYLKSLGCQNTHFVNPSGLHLTDHQTTAKDMSIIAQEAMKNPFFRQIVKTTSYLRPETNKQPAHMLTQTNRLLKQGPYYYPKAIGIKTGYYSKAGHALVAAAQEGDRMLIAIILHCTERGDAFKDAIKLFDTAFKEPLQVRHLMSKGTQKYNVKVKGGKGVLQTYLSDDITVKFYPSEEPSVKAVLNWKEDLIAPLEKDSIVGTIVVRDERGRVLKEVPLLALNALEQTFASKFQDQLGEYSTLLKGKKGYALGGLVLVMIGLLWWINKRRRPATSSY
ncbi:MAG: D-alanyl-D-alanine carboxypeptidase [Parachlamydiales bacterium]|nr:D-alanyl-D-alanine carboxypeptidase [Parachlamydiales bacterium]